ncbi:MAG: hypothetical protein ACKVQR_04480 [Aquabacterium sp.]
MAKTSIPHTVRKNRRGEFEVEMWFTGHQGAQGTGYLVVVNSWLAAACLLQECKAGKITGKYSCCG